MIVYVEVLRPSQPNAVMLNAVSLPNHMFTGQAVSADDIFEFFFFIVFPRKKVLTFHANCLPWRQCT